MNIFIFIKDKLIEYLIMIFLLLLKITNISNIIIIIFIMDKQHLIFNYYCFILINYKL